jgi:hypothetical protein
MKQHEKHEVFVDTCKEIVIGKFFISRCDRCPFSNTNNGLKKSCVSAGFSSGFYACGEDPKLLESAKKYLSWELTFVDGVLLSVPKGNPLKDFSDEELEEELKRRKLETYTRQIRSVWTPFGEVKARAEFNNLGMLRPQDWDFIRLLALERFINGVIVFHKFSIMTKSQRKQALYLLANAKGIMKRRVGEVILE